MLIRIFTTRRASEQTKRKEEHPCTKTRTEEKMLIATSIRMTNLFKTVSKMAQPMRAKPTSKTTNVPADRLCASQEIQTGTQIQMVTRGTLHHHQSHQR